MRPAFSRLTCEYFTAAAKLDMAVVDKALRYLDSSKVLGKMARWSASRWRIAGGIAVVFSFVAFGWFAQTVQQNGLQSMLLGFMWGVIGAGVGGGGIVVLYLVLRLWKDLETTERQYKALSNVRPITGSRPLDLGGWAVDEILADALVRRIVRNNPQVIVECGSGWSTVLIASCLIELGTGSVVAFEHRKESLESTRRLLNQYACAECASVVHAPIGERVVDGETVLWYSARVESAVEEQIDLLLVDGPPGEVGPQSRYPAVPLLEDKLSSDATILLDDARRSEESVIAQRWARRLDSEAQFLNSESGVYIFDL